MGRLLIIVQCVLLALLLVAPSRSDSVRESPPAIVAFAAQNGIPSSFVERGGVRFLLVPPGSFSFTAPSGDTHTITLRLPYYIQATPAFEGLTWAEARARGAAMTTANGDHVYRLPTEAEWTLAERAYATQDGAVAEMWCADWFGPPAEQDLSDPVGPREGRSRVVRSPGRPRRALSPDRTEPDLGARLVAELGWRGDREVTIRTVVRDLTGAVAGEKSGYRVHLIRILDRLADRQAGRVEEWTELEGTSPLEVRMFPGRYYLVAVDGDATGTLRMGPELKIHVAEGSHTFEVDVPGPRIPPPSKR